MHYISLETPRESIDVLILLPSYVSDDLLIVVGCIADLPKGRTDTVYRTASTPDYLISVQIISTYTTEMPNKRQGQ